MKRTALKRRASRHERAPDTWTAGVRWMPCENCGARSAHAHHLIDKAVCRREGAPLWDLRNRMLLCMDCHFAHHARTITLRLPAGHPVHEFAAEHGLAWWVERRYQTEAAA